VAIHRLILINALAPGAVHSEKPPFRLVQTCVPILPRNAFFSDNRHFPICLFIPCELPALPCRRESPSHPPSFQALRRFGDNASK
jgi:hypothetical protein